MRRALFVCLAVSVLPVAGGTFSGSLKTKQGLALADMAVQATRTETGDIVSFVIDRAGAFSVELPDGTWTLVADPVNLDKLGLSPLADPTVTMSGGAPLVVNLVLHANEPLRKPTLDFTRTSAGALSFKVSGQAGTRVTIYSSTDLKHWSSYYGRAITTGFSYTVNNPPGNFPKRYFKAVATTD